MNRPANTVSLSPALRQLLIDCHTFCSSVDCCRGDAFEISHAIIERWLEFERVDRTWALVEEIKRIQAALNQFEGDVVLTARGLESTWPVEEFKMFWNRVQSTFASVRDARKG